MASGNKALLENLQKRVAKLKVKEEDPAAEGIQLKTEDAGKVELTKEDPKLKEELFLSFFGPFLKKK